MCENYENCAYSYTYTEEFSCNKAKKRGVAVEYRADLHNKVCKKPDKSICHLKTNS